MHHNVDIEDFDKTIIRIALEDGFKRFGSIGCFVQQYSFALAKDPDRFRSYFLEDAAAAYFYAREVDKYPREDTKNSACMEPYFAYCYAQYVDNFNLKQTRTATCKSPKWAYWFARYVDFERHEETWKAVQGTEWEQDYLNFVGID